MTYGIIYKATGPTGKVYIGQTTQTLKARKSAHKFMSLKGNKRTPFQFALLEAGFSNFTWEQIDQAENQAELDAKEKQWIARYDSMNPANGYNGTDGGISYSPSQETRKKISKSLTGKHPSEEARKKMSKTRQGEKNHFYGKRHSEEARRKMGEAAKGCKRRLGAILSDETKRKISEACKGKTASAEHRRKVSEAGKKRRHTEEERRKISEANRGKRGKITEETARNIKADLANGDRQADIAKKYGVSRGLVFTIKAGKNWAWL